MQSVVDAFLLRIDYVSIFFRCAAVRLAVQFGGVFQFIFFVASTAAKKCLVKEQFRAFPDFFCLLLLFNSVQREVYAHIFHAQYCLM